MLEKYLTHLAASQLTQAVMSGLTTPTDPMQRQVLACQIQVNFFEWLKNTYADPAWPTPPIDFSALTKCIAAALSGGLPPLPGPAPAPAPTPAPGPIPAISPVTTAPKALGVKYPGSGCGGV